MPAGLLAYGSDASTSLPDFGKTCRVSGVSGRSSPLTVAGAAPELRLPFRRTVGAHRIPIFTGDGFRRARTFTEPMCSDQPAPVKRGTIAPGIAATGQSFLLCRQCLDICYGLGNRGACQSRRLQQGFNAGQINTDGIRAPTPFLGLKRHIKIDA